LDKQKWRCLDCKQEGSTAIDGALTDDLIRCLMVSHAELSPNCPGTNLQWVVLEGTEYHTPTGAYVTTVWK